MNDAVRNMLSAYKCNTSNDYVNALREIIQELALLGLWRSKFFEHAAFYGGTALRMAYGLDRYSEDLDFSLLAPNPSFTLKNYGDALQEEISSFGFQVAFTKKEKLSKSSIDSGFIKANTYSQLITIVSDSEVIAGVNQRQELKIKLEIDVNPPDGFTTETKYQYKPIPYALRMYTLPNLFAGKMHAVLCRKWASRQKGRDWYDFVWYAGNHPDMNLTHLEARMRHSGDYVQEKQLTWKHFQNLLKAAIEETDIDQIRNDVSPFVHNQQSLELWSKDFFRDAASRIKQAE